MRRTNSSASSSVPGSIWLNSRSSENALTRTRFGGSLTGGGGVRSISTTILTRPMTLGGGGLTSPKLLLFTFRKIPFTCSYLTGKANITGLWFIYWLGFATYAYSMASLESWALESALQMMYLYLAGTVLVGVA